MQWADKRIDIVGQYANETQYRYKYWDGHQVCTLLSKQTSLPCTDTSCPQWNPSHDTWYPKGGDFASQPALASRGDQNLNIFGIATDGTLKWQFWNEGQWLPSSTEYYSLGNTSDPYPSKSGQESNLKGAGPVKDNDQVVLDGYKYDI